MSWAEENGYDSYESPDYSYLEDCWKDGLHETQDGRKIKLKTMTKQHLRNTIKYFIGYDTKPLKHELNKRNI